MSEKEKEKGKEMKKRDAKQQKKQEKIQAKLKQFEAPDEDEEKAVTSTAIKSHNVVDTKTKDSV